MFHQFKDYFQFSKAERKGVIALVIVIILLIITKQSLVYLSPEISYRIQTLDSLTAQLEQLKEAEELNQKTKRAKPQKIEVADFDPNNYPILKQNNNVIPYLTQLNANIIWFDYRGFGFTSGVASFDVLKRDAAHIYESVRHKVKRPLVLHGLSIGSILAIDVASNYDVENLVLEGSITTVKDWVNYSFVAQAYYSHGIPKLIGYLIKPLFNVEPSKEIAAIDNHKALLTHKGRLLMLTGENDWETPPEINKKLFDSIEAGRSSYFHVIENVGHLDTLTSENAIDIYRTFLSN